MLQNLKNIYIDSHIFIHIYILCIHTYIFKIWTFSQTSLGHLLVDFSRTYEYSIITSKSLHV